MTCFIFFSWLEKCFEVTENVQKFNFEGDWAKVRLKLVCLENPGQNIWHKVKKSSKIGQDFKSPLSSFACFLRPIAKILFLEGCRKNLLFFLWFVYCKIAYCPINMVEILTTYLNEYIISRDWKPSFVFF